ncbi:hypothetical protein O181_033434 [Austropuccinia psidii MF-1]|uniref:Secreted protein n=1 Tax=Austropuccinia psidii MF-1 TaxID=1389203 RepID=A0A9Q3H8K1_9BASI|nr:hypothetical protein [Austropuccinia psidii MF-1]
MHTYASTSLKFTIFTLLHCFPIISTAYHAYAPNSSSLHSCNDFLLNQKLVISPIDHSYTHPHIYFHICAIYHPYASEMPPHHLCTLKFLHSCNDWLPHQCLII